MTAARPFRLAGVSALAALQVRVQEACAEWAADRLGEAAAARCESRVLAARELPADADVVLPALVAEGPHGTFWAEAEQAVAMEEALFTDPAAPGSLAATLARRALEELLAAMAGGPARPCPQQVLDPHLPGRALACVHLAVDGHALSFLAELPAAAACPPASPLHDQPLPLAAALQQQTVTVRASLGRVQVDLGTLHQLRPGDILRLDKCLDDPIDLDIDGHPLPCEAHLVASAHRKAVELGRRSTSSRIDSTHA